MKVLYIGHYREGTSSGWARSSISRILSLDSVGIEVCARPLKLNGNNPNIPNRILELEQVSPKYCDICIQEVLPHLYHSDSHFKRNIGIYFTETDDFSASSWDRHINLMDECWIPNSSMRKSSIDSGVTVPLYEIPPPLDVEKYQKNYQPIDAIKNQANGDFLFYFIGDFNRRKNIAGLLKAFHLEFTTNEPVSLVIKTGKFGVSPNQLQAEIREMIGMVRTQVKFYKDIKQYKPEIVLTDDFSDDDLCRLHNTCDCYVCPSYAEAWGFPVLDAMGFGKIVIANRVGGMQDYIKHMENGLLVESYEQSVFGMNVPNEFPFLYSGHENWKDPNISDLRYWMRLVYDQRNDIWQETMKEQAVEAVYNFSFEKVGEKMKNQLEHVLKGEKL